MPKLALRPAVLAVSLAACTERDPLDSATVAHETSEATSTSAADTTTGPTAPPTTLDPATGSLTDDTTTVPATTGPPGLGLSHARHIQPIWDANCVAGCHTPGGLSPSWLILSEGAYEAIVGVPALELPSMPLATPSDLASSYLWHKLNDTHIDLGGSGSRMPSPPRKPLPPDQRDLVALWIAQGCPP